MRLTELRSRNTSNQLSSKLRSGRLNKGFRGANQVEQNFRESYPSTGGYQISVWNSKISGVSFINGKVLVHSNVSEEMARNVSEEYRQDSKIYLKVDELSNKTQKIKTVRVAYVRDYFDWNRYLTKKNLSPYLIVVRDLSIISPAYNVTQWMYSTNYHFNQIAYSYDQKDHQKTLSSFFVDRDQCYLYVKRIQPSQNRSTLRDQTTGVESDNVTLELTDELNNTHSINIIIETNRIQLEQSLNKTKPVPIENIFNFTSFSFYDHFEAQGSWFDLDESISPNSKLAAKADTTIHTFTELHLANYVQRTKYQKQDNYTLFKATLYGFNQSSELNDLIIYTNLSLTNSLRSRAIYEEVYTYLFQTPAIGQYGNSAFSILTSPESNSSFYFIPTNLDPKRADTDFTQKPNDVKMLSILNSYPRYEQESEASSFLILVLDNS